MTAYGRAGPVVDLILGDDEIRNRQLVITTHGEEFVKRLENAVPKVAYKATVSRIVPYANQCEEDRRKAGLATTLPRGRRAQFA